MKESKDDFLKKNNLIFQKYKPLKKIGQGSFGNIYSVMRLNDKSLFALKTEKINYKDKILESEAYYLFTLQGFGIPKFISYGHTKNYNILIEELLGKSLKNIFIENNAKCNNIIDICLIGIQILDRLEYIHSKNIIYRDIKPENFLIGIKEPNIIYIIDFGLCKKYRSSKTGKHILPKLTGKFNGTLRYASPNSLKGKEPSRRDDLISLGYMLIFLYKKKLPWDFETPLNISTDKFIKQFIELKSLKETNGNGNLFKNLPNEIIEYIKYTKNLKFEENPNYSYLRSLFKKLLFNMYLDHRILTFSWIQSENKIFFGIPRNRSLDKKPSYDKEIFNNNSNSPKNINKRNASQTNVKRKNENFIIPIHNNAIAISNVEVIPNELKEFQSNILRNEQNIRIDSILNDNKNNQINILKIPNNKNNNFNNRVIGINPYTKEFRNKKKNYKTNLINIDNKSYVNDNNIKLKKIKINNININSYFLKNNNDIKKRNIKNNRYIETDNNSFKKDRISEYNLNNRFKKYISIFKSSPDKINFNSTHINPGINSNIPIKRINNKLNYINLNNSKINNQIVKNNSNQNFNEVGNNIIIIKKTNNILRKNKFMFPSPYFSPVKYLDNKNKIINYNDFNINKNIINNNSFNVIRNKINQYNNNSIKNHHVSPSPHIRSFAYKK